MLVGYLLQDIEVVYEEFVIGQQDLKFGDFRRDDIACFRCMHVVELILLDDLSNF